MFHFLEKYTLIFYAVHLNCLVFGRRLNLFWLGIFEAMTSTNEVSLTSRVIFSLYVNCAIQLQNNFLPAMITVEYVSF